MFQLLRTVNMMRHNQMQITDSRVMAIFMLLIHEFRIQLRSKFAKFVFVFCSRGNDDLIQLSIRERVL